MNPLAQLRMPNIFGGPRQPDTSYPRLNNTQYPMYNEFLSSIAPMRMARIQQEQLEQDQAIDSRRQVMNQPVPAATMPNPAFQAAMLETREGGGGGRMNVHYKDNNINPYQTAQLDLQNRRLAATTADQASDNKLATFRAEETARKNAKAETDKAASFEETKRRTAASETDRERRTIVAEFQANNPNVTITKTPQGLLATDRTGKAVFLKDKDGANISSGMLSDQDEMAQRQRNTERNIVLGGDQTRRTNLERPVKADSPGQQEVGRAAKAAELVARNPELNEFITFDERGNPVIAEETDGGYFGKPFTKEQRARVLNDIYGSGAAPANAPANTSTAPAGDKRARAIAALQAGGKVVNEDTIAKIIARLK